MSEHSTIEWTDATWNPVTGCTKVSEGCRNCYMARTVPRQKLDPWKVTLHPDRLEIPLHWRRPRKIFVNSLSDLFHEDVPDAFIDQVFFTMGQCSAIVKRWTSRYCHTFQILTKRPQRMRDYFIGVEKRKPKWLGLRGLLDFHLRNVWLGVSVEDQATADERIPLLLQTPFAVRFVSVEPLLGSVSLRWLSAFPESAPYTAEHPSGHTDHLDGLRRLDWIIVGGESGPGARPMHPDWVRSIREQCQAANVPLFFKQWGEWAPETNLDPLDHMDAITINNACCHIFEEGVRSYRVGKKRAGRLLDSQTHSAFPMVVA